MESTLKLWFKNDIDSELYPQQIYGFIPPETYLHILLKSLSTILQMDIVVDIALRSYTAYCVHHYDQTHFIYHCGDIVIETISFSKHITAKYCQQIHIKPRVWLIHATRELPAKRRAFISLCESRLKT